MLTIQHHNLGGNILVIYDFPDVGDELPKHVHDEHSNHITVVAKGSFSAYGEGWERTLVSGNIVDWPVGQAHAFTALEAGSRMVNIKRG